jgi:hypothetical protein
MALPPKFGGHRLVITDATASGPSANEPLHTLEFYLDYVCPFSASTSSPNNSFPSPSPSPRNQTS